MVLYNNDTALPEIGFKRGNEGAMDLNKYLEKKSQNREAIQKLKLKMKGYDENIVSVREPAEFGTYQHIVERDHQFLRSTPRSNILQAARMIKTRYLEKLEFQKTSVTT